MTRHWKIRYRNKDEYVPVRDIWQAQVDQVIEQLMMKNYDLTEVLVIETATKTMYKNILKM